MNGCLLEGISGTTEQISVKIVTGITHALEEHITYFLLLNSEQQSVGQSNYYIDGILNPIYYWFVSLHNKLHSKFNLKITLLRKVIFYPNLNVCNLNIV